MKTKRYTKHTGFLSILGSVFRKMTIHWMLIFWKIFVSKNDVRFTHLHGVPKERPSINIQKFINYNYDKVNDMFVSKIAYFFYINLKRIVQILDNRWLCRISTDKSIQNFKTSKRCLIFIESKIIKYLQPNLFFFFSNSDLIKKT